MLVLVMKPLKPNRLYVNKRQASYYVFRSNNAIKLINNFLLFPATKTLPNDVLENQIHENQLQNNDVFYIIEIDSVEKIAHILAKNVSGWINITNFENFVEVNVAPTTQIKE